MNKKYFYAFLAGVAVGSFFTWRYAKKKYEILAQEEIDSVKEVFSRRKGNASEHIDKTLEYDEYTATVQQCGYESYSDRKEEDTDNKPYVIAPEEFGDFEEYEKISLSYYADQILADENDEIIVDVDEIVGFESLTHFGEYEDDSVFVRNDKLKCDYEILLDRRTYSDVLKLMPHPVEV